MVKIDILLFGICFKLDLHIHRVPKNADKCNKQVQQEEFEETPINDHEEYSIFDENKIARIAEQFQSELDSSSQLVFDIPEFKDEDILPPRYGIQADVEIITDRYEKEVEDVIEGRR